MAGFKLKVMNQSGFDNRIRKQSSATQINVERVVNSIANNKLLSNIILVF